MAQKVMHFYGKGVRIILLVRPQLFRSDTNWKPKNRLTKSV